MLHSAEVRWFWIDHLPAGVEDWFTRSGNFPFKAGGGKTRVDQYLRDPKQNELGVKLRGDKPGVEIKTLISVDWLGVTTSPFVGPIERWAKYASESLKLEALPLIKTEKTRWLRKFDTTTPIPKEIELGADEKPTDDRPLPALGCNVELTKVELPSSGHVWWTLGFEAFGSPETIINDLRSVASQLASMNPPQIGAGLLASYPTWLSKVA